MNLKLMKVFVIVSVFALIFGAVIDLSPRNVEAQTSSDAQENDSDVFLPLVLSVQQSEGSAFTELAADTELTGEQQAVLETITTDPSTVRLRLVTSDNALLRTAQSLQLNVFGDVVLEVATDRVEVRSDDDFTWYGSNSSTQTLAIIVVNGDDATGTVTDGDKLYRILPMGEGVHANTEADVEQLDGDHPAEFEQVQKRSLSRQDMFLDQQSTIRILVAFTPAAQREVGNINALIQLAIDETNLSFAKSDIDKTVQLAHVYETSYSETGNMSRDLGRLRAPSDGFMDEVHSFRNTYSADIVMLISSRNYGYCGMASVILANYESAFALAAQHCATGYYTFGHELGHLLGARHNPEADPNTSPFPYGHGYYPPSQNWRTVMSYNCPNGCARLPYWSNPNVSYYGEKMGTSARHDNARVLNGDASTPPTNTPRPTATNTPRPTVTDTPRPTATQIQNNAPPIKVSTPDLVVPGEQFRYAITVYGNTNIDGTATGWIEDPLPDLAEYVGNLDCGGGECAYDRETRTVTWSGELGPESIVTVEFDVRVPEEVPTDWPEIINRARVHDGTLTYDVEAVTTVLCVPTKVPSVTTITPGQKYGYTITLPASPAADGPLDASIYDDLPNVLQFQGDLECSLPGACDFDPTGNGVFWFGTLEPGDEVTMSFSVSVRTDIPPEECPSIIFNTAIVDDGVTLQPVFSTVSVVCE